MLLRALVVLPKPMRQRLARLVADAPVRLVDGGRNAGERLGHDAAELVLVHAPRLTAAFAGALAERRAAGDAPDVIVFVDHEDPPQRAQWLAEGVLAVLNLTLDDALLQEALRSVVQRARDAAVQRLRARRGEPPASLADFVSHSDDMQRLLVVAKRMVDSDATLLVMGETGVGKERLARAIHDEGPRQGGPFVAINCGAMPEALLESELFGHEQGAFTGAVRAHRGLFELAHGGTLFLDEVGEMPLALQVKLLRVLQDRRIRPVGGERDLTVDVRVVAATNRDLQQEMRAGRFRPDLYYRLAVVALTIPPLRERRADVPVLVQNHLESLCMRLNRRPLAVHPDAMAMLCRYDWPGNVRELANVLERAVLLGDGTVVTPQDLSGLDGDAARGRTAGSAASGLFARPFAAAAKQVGDDFARDYFTRLLRECRGRVGDVAARAGLGPRTLYGILRRLGLEKGGFRGADGAES